MSEEEQNLTGDELESDLFPESLPAKTDVGDYWVVKRNEMIRGQYDLSASSQKMLASLLSLIDPTDPDPLKPQELTVSDLSHLLGVSRQYLYRTIDQATTELKQLYARLPLIDEEPDGQQSVDLGESFRKISFFRECQFDNRRQVVTWEWEKRLTPYIQGFTKNFTKYQLRQIRGLNSGYSIRIYEILRSYHSLSNVKKGNLSIVRNLSLDLLREQLGIPDSRYPEISRFRRKVLDVAQKELKDTDLEFSYAFPERTPERPRARVSYIQFRIIARSPVDRVKTSEGLLMTFTGHFGKRVAVALINDYGESVCRENMVYAYRVSESTNGSVYQIKNMPAFIRFCIKNDIASTKGALNPAEYEHQNQKDFLRDQLIPAWPNLPQGTRDAFIEKRFQAPEIRDAYQDWLGESGRSVDKTEARDGLRNRLRDLTDIDW